MDKFCILPTDERFLNLYEDQKYMLFSGINNLPDLNRLKNMVDIKTRIDIISDKRPEEFANEGRMNSLKKMFESQGFKAEEVKKKIKEYLITLKNAEIAKLERERLKNA